MADVMIDEEFGNIDESGEIVIQSKYDGAKSFSESLTAVEFKKDKMKISKN